jgi:hypothetical protein
MASSTIKGAPELLPLKTRLTSGITKNAVRARCGETIAGPRVLAQKYMTNIIPRKGLMVDKAPLKKDRKNIIYSTT